MNKIEVLHPGFVEVTIADEAIAQYLPVERGALITSMIRKRYTLDDELAILANGEDTEAHAKEYQEYQEYRAEIKAGIAEIQLAIDITNKEWEDAQPKHEPMGKREGEENE